jgi:50S ribosomal protein L16 3-hydroxylase
MASMIDPDRPLALLGGLAPAQFMRRHWQRKPLLVRRALADAAPPLSRAALFNLAGRDDVESRLVVRDGRQWSVRRGPLPRRALPPLASPNWTLLVQGLDLHVDEAHALLSRFRFVPDVRLDDLMLSYAGDGGGVGPHIDSYDVFLLQLSGRRRWRFGPCSRPALRDDVPLKMLAAFEPTDSHVLEPGDLLYLPPGWAHEGTAVGPQCMTASIGFRAPTQVELAQALLVRMADEGDDDRSRRYRDVRQEATVRPGALPAALRAFARQAVARALRQHGAVDRALGEWLTEPKSQVFFDRAAGAVLHEHAAVVLDRRTRMAYVDRQVFINGESFTAGGRDAALVRRLADARQLPASEVSRLSPGARALIAEWLVAGWMHAKQEGEDRHA